MSDPKGEFYVGYDDTAPPETARFIRHAVILVFVLAAVIPIALVLAQRPFARSAFEFTTVRDFEGTIKSDPYPRLLVARPGKTPPGEEFSSYALVAPGKHGADDATRAAADRAVRLKGKLIHRAGEVMIEVVPGSISAIEPAPAPLPPIALSSLEEVKFIGEIVDSKCYLGVMNPGQTKPHRACAIRCISGGIPPMFATRAPDGRTRLYFITDPEGEPINREILPYVGIPVEIEGAAQQAGPVFFLRTSASSIRPLR